MGVFLHNCMPSLHSGTPQALERTFATGVSRKKVETIALCIRLIHKKVL